MVTAAVADLTDDQADQAIERFCEANFSRISNKSGFLMVPARSAPAPLATRAVSHARKPPLYNVPCTCHVPTPCVRSLVRCRLQCFRPRASLVLSCRCRVWDVAGRRLRLV